MDREALSLEALGVKLPYSIEAEQAVLGAALLNRELVPDMVSKLRQEYFYSSQNGAIFFEICQMFNAAQPIDFVTLLGRVVDASVFDAPEDAKVYLTNLAQTVPHLSNMDTYIRIIEEKYQIRTLMNAVCEILDMTSKESDAQLLLETAEQKIYEIRRGRDQSALMPMKNVLLDTLSYLQDITGSGASVGVPTGFTQLDRVLTGFGKSDLIILAARPGMGKTSFALNIADNVAKRSNIPVAIFSLEMSRDQLVTRILSSEAAIDSHSLRTGKLSASDWQDIAGASEVMSKMPIFMDDTPNVTTAEIKAKVRRINQDPERPDIGLIIIDYLQLMNSGRKIDSRVQEVSEITRNLKIMAKELSVPVLCLSQLSRATERGSTNNHRPALSDLRDSGSIEQDADVVLFLLRDAYYDDATGDEEPDSTSATCIVAKNRHGETADVPLGWDGAHTRFVNVEFSNG